jgi:erythromycin esterase-like protein
MLKLRRFAAAALLPLWIAAQTPAPDAVTEWIQGAAIPLATPVAGNGFDDMQPLKKVVGDARIVSLGEATHGTREFFQLKHRMLEFLATEMGFTIFSIEASMPEAYRLNDYVLHGKGDPARLIAGMYFWTWNTEEVLDMVLWMRKFNESGKGPVQFTGFDMQYPGVANEIIREFVVRADPEYAPVLAEASKLALAPFRPSGPAFGTALGTFAAAALEARRFALAGISRRRMCRGMPAFGGAPTGKIERPRLRIYVTPRRRARPTGNVTNWS